MSIVNSQALELRKALQAERESYLKKIAVIDETLAAIERLIQTLPEESATVNATLTFPKMKIPRKRRKVAGNGQFDDYEFVVGLLRSDPTRWWGPPEVEACLLKKKDEGVYDKPADYIKFRAIRLCKRMLKHKPRKLVELNTDKSKKTFYRWIQTGAQPAVSA